MNGICLFCCVLKPNNFTTYSLASGQSYDHTNLSYGNDNSLDSVSYSSQHRCPQYERKYLVLFDGSVGHESRVMDWKGNIMINTLWAQFTDAKESSFKKNRFNPIVKVFHFLFGNTVIVYYCFIILSYICHNKSCSMSVTVINTNEI